MQFDVEGNLKSHVPPSREIPIPVLFGLPPFAPPPGVREAAGARREPAHDLRGGACGGDSRSGSLST